MLGTLLAGIVIGAVATLIVVRHSVRELRGLLRQGKAVQAKADEYAESAERYYQMAKAHDANAEEARAAAARHEASAEDILDKARALHTEMMT